MREKMLQEMTLHELFEKMHGDAYNFLDCCEKFMERLRNQEAESISMIKGYGSKEIDKQVWVCQKCEMTCLTSYRSKAPKYCPCCGRKVENAEV